MYGNICNNISINKIGIHYKCTLLWRHIFIKKYNQVIDKSSVGAHYQRAVCLHGIEFCMVGLIFVLKTKMAIIGSLHV